MLLEELLGISNKRLRKIFNGEPQDDDSSSTEEEEEKPADVISLDDVTDDDFVIDLDSGKSTYPSNYEYYNIFFLDNEKTKSKKKKKGRIKEEPKEKKIKKEKYDKSRSNKNDDGIMDEASEEHLMSVLELLELQARARAIRSQLALENSRKTKQKELEEKEKPTDNSDVDDAIIIESPNNEEIVITSSDSEMETNDVNKISTHSSRSHKKNTGHYVVAELAPSNKRNETVINDLGNNPSKTSRIELSIENPEEMNKLFNKLHKLKRQKRKLDHKTSKFNNQGTETGNCMKDVINSEDKISMSEGDLESEMPLNPGYPSTSKSCDNDRLNPNSFDGDGIILNLDQAEIDSIHRLVESSGNTQQKLAKPVKTKVKELDDSSKEISSQNSHTKINSMTSESENFEERIKNNCLQKELFESMSDEKEHINEEGDGIILNVDQSEMESINLDSL